MEALLRVVEAHIGAVKAHSRAAEGLEASRPVSQIRLCAFPDSYVKKAGS
jgi:hypothetical protein